MQITYSEVLIAQVNLPGWLDDKTWQKRKAAKDVMAAFQSTLAVQFACSKLFERTHGFFNVESDEGTLGKLVALKVLLRLVPPCDSNAENSLSREAIEDLEVLSKKADFISLSSEISAQLRDSKAAKSVVEEIVCQGFDRDGAIFTPKDVAIFMGRLAGIENECVAFTVTMVRDCSTAIAFKMLTAFGLLEMRLLIKEMNGLGNFLRD